MRTCRNCKEKLIAIRGNGVAYIKDLSAFIKSDKVKRQLEGVRRLRMRSKGNAPTAAQKRWREAVRELGSVISGDPAVIHHPVGTTGKHNKVDIGHWWVIPLTDEEHKALHDGKTFGHESRKDFEKAAFNDVCVKLAFEGFDWTVSPEVDCAIMDYHR